MNHLHFTLRNFPYASNLTVARSVFLILFTLQIPADAQEQPFDFCGNPLVFQGEQLMENFATWPLSEMTPIGSANGTEINNMGYHVTEDLLFGVELTASGNVGIVKIDSNGDVSPVGQAGLPTDKRFDAGDLSDDGSTMYVNFAGFSPLYVVDLGTMTTTAVELSGDRGWVHDWAYFDGLLFGGDTRGQIAVLDPESGYREDFSIAELPAGVAYGGAWFASPSVLSLYRNNGWIYDVDLSDIANTGPRFLGSRQASDIRSTQHIDGAICPREMTIGLFGWFPCRLDSYCPGGRNCRIRLDCSSI